MMPEGEPVTEGYIALQSEGHPMQFRRIELLEVPDAVYSHPLSETNN
jgi:hypothetical protein